MIPARRLAAHHEAGHCVAYNAYREFGFGLCSVTLGEDGAGRTQGTSPSDIENDFRNAVVALAGGAAEMILSGKPASLKNCAADYQDALLELCDHTMVWLAAERAIKLVADNWPLVELLAAELERTGVLSGADLERLLNG